MRRDVLTAVDELTARGLVTETVPATPIPMIEPPIECTGCGDGPDVRARVLLAVDEGLLAVGVDAALAPELAAAFGSTAMGVIEAGPHVVRRRPPGARYRTGPGRRPPLPRARTSWPGPGIPNPWSRR